MSLSWLEWLLIAIIIVQLFFRFTGGKSGGIFSSIVDFIFSGFRLVGAVFKTVFSWLGLWPALAAVIGWFGGNGWISRTVRSVLSVAVTALSALSGYCNGYNRGYDDAIAGRSRSWTASIHRMFFKQEK
ncbi:MAG: hypothetical protein II877_04930 [Synergistaceae bacterium]|nr:hypothetical protein [Synergistaceae bacterium]MBQ7169960.1 hypothetical protein [Synergistaceae bacterium]